MISVTFLITYWCIQCSPLFISQLNQHYWFLRHYNFVPATLTYAWHTKLHSFTNISALWSIYSLLVYLTPSKKNIKLCVSYVLVRPRLKFYNTNKTDNFVFIHDSDHTVHRCFNHLSVTLQMCLSESQEDNASINLCMKI